MGLDSEIREILELNAEAKGLDKTAGSVNDEARNKLKDLAERIKKGESTGDTVRDFVIAHSLAVCPDAEKQYRTLLEKFKAGSRFLIVEKREAMHGCPGIIPPPRSEYERFMHIDTELKLGVLISGVELDINSGNIVFPTEKYARRHDWRSDKWELKQGKLGLAWYRISELNRDFREKLSRKFPWLCSSDSIQIFAGDEASSYFCSKIALYAEALLLLGVEAPEKFSEQYNKELRKKRIGLVNKLEELANAEAQLTGRIDYVYKAASGGEGIIMENGAACVVSGKDDAFFVTLNARDKLNETRAEIQRCLNNALDLRMHNCDLILEQKPGMEMNVAKYISGMCEKYKVEIRT
jgi:hypothetical protein